MKANLSDGVLVVSAPKESRPAPFSVAISTNSAEDKVEQNESKAATNLEEDKKETLAHANGSDMAQEKHLSEDASSKSD